MEEVRELYRKAKDGLLKNISHSDRENLDFIPPTTNIFGMSGKPHPMFCWYK